MLIPYSPFWKRLLYRVIPFLFNECPEGYYHWRWERLCFCGLGSIGGHWHGGILDMKLNLEYQYCEKCTPRLISEAIDNIRI